MLIGLVDRSDKLVEFRDFLDGPGPFERWSEHSEIMLGQEADCDNALLIHVISTLVAPWSA